MNQPVNNRITSIDYLRGLIMVIMALDHVRDYFFADSYFYDALDLEKTNAVLFFTRWITHFCAPVFMLLAGTSAYLTGLKKTKSQLAGFLLKRGLWLVFLEMTVVNFGWHFNPFFPMFLFVTIWALGIGMIVLAGFIYLPRKYIIAICLLLVCGHNLLDNVHVEGNSPAGFGWALLHDQRAFTWQGKMILVGYPIIPLMAVMPLGYCLGVWFNKNHDAVLRQKKLLRLGLACIGGFILLRLVNIYGDPHPWTTQPDGFFTFLSFIKINKYPPSLLYLLVTLGGAFLFLALTEKSKGTVVRIVSVYGRVPMFYYITHIYLIHLLAMLVSVFTPGQNWQMWILENPIWASPNLKGTGFSLPVVYFIWIAVVAGLYPFCKWYDRYKQSHKEKWWLSYL